MISAVLMFMAFYFHLGDDSYYDKCRKYKVSMSIDNVKGLLVVATNCHNLSTERTKFNSKSLDMIKFKRICS